MYVCMQLYMQAGLNCRLSWSYQLDASRSCWWKRLSATPLGLHLKQRPPWDGKGRRPVIHHHRWSHSWSYVYARARQRLGRLLRAPLSYSKLMSWNDYCHSLWTEWQPIAIYIYPPVSHQFERDSIRLGDAYSLRVEYWNNLCECQHQVDRHHVCVLCDCCHIYLRMACPVCVDFPL